MCGYVFMLRSHSCPSELGIDLDLGYCYFATGMKRHGIS